MNNDSIPSCRIDISKERYKEYLLEKTKLKLKENDSLKKNLNIT